MENEEQAPKKSEAGPKITAVQFQDGGVDFGSYSVKASLKVAPNLGGKPAILSLESTVGMRLDKSGGWLICRWETSKGKHEKWVPREQVRSIDVEVG